MKNLREMLSLSMQLVEVTEFVRTFWPWGIFWTYTYFVKKKVKKTDQGHFVSRNETMPG